MNTINVENCKTLLIGRRGENEVTTVAFDFTEWASEFGSGVVDLYVKRFGDNSAYPVVLTIDGTVASWLVTETDTNVAGYGKAEYVYRVDGKIAKSAVFPFFVAEDIGQPASEPPDPYESWLEQLTALGAETEAHAQAAEQSAEDAADSAEDAAQSAASAEGYAGQAETAAGLAQAAQTASEAARDAAQTAQASAEASATAASGSATSAAGSATAAAGSASDASASATAAGASATTASTAAGQAEAAKTAAQTAQSAADDAAEDAQQAAQQAHVEYEQLSGEVDDLSDEVTQQKSAIEDLEALTNRKAGMLVDSVSGAIASFTPDATIDNLLGVSVDIEPVQDLHGFDSPWPAGGGRNKLPYATIESPLTKNGITFAINQDGSIAVNGTSTASFAQTFVEFALHPGSYYFNCGNGISMQTYTYIYIRDADNSRTLAEINAGNIGIDRTFSIDAQTNVRFYMVFGASDLGISGTLYPMIRLATETDATYAPYENICPISGWDAVDVERTGVNVLNQSNPVFANMSVADGVYTSTNTDSRSYFDATLRTIYDDGTYTQYAIAQISAAGEYSKAITATKGVSKIAVLHNGSQRNFSVIFNDSRLKAGNYIFSFKVTKADPTTIGGVEFTNLQISPGTTASAYHPYAGNRYTITLGDTVYGAKLTIAEDGGVTALIDRAELVVTDCSEVGTASTGMPYARKNIAVLAKAESTSNKNISSEYRYRVNAPSDSGWFRVVKTVIYIFDSRFTDLATANNILSSEKPQIVFELATPIEIQLDPVTISTISGQINNVWADAGDVTVEYAADLKTYIDSKIAAAVAALS